MIYKVLAIEYYPSGLGTTYNCTVTDQKQSKITSTMANTRVYLYDLNNAQNTSVNNNNTVTISANRINGNINLAGYSYITNNLTTTQLLNSTSSTNFTITNLRDPGAKIIFYGAGSGTITTSSVDESTTVIGGRTFRIQASYSISASTFSYPNNNLVTITVTPNYTGSGEGLSAPNSWTHYWTVKFNGIDQGNYSITGNGNTGAGSFSFKCPYDTKWTISPPKIEVYCSRIEAYYNYTTGGTTVVHTGFRVNKGGYTNPYTGQMGVTGTKLLTGETVFVNYDDYPYASQYGSGTWDIGGIIVSSQYGESYEWSEQQSGTTYSGYVTYYG